VSEALGEVAYILGNPGNARRIYRPDLTAITYSLVLSIHPQDIERQADMDFKLELVAVTRCAARQRDGNEWVSFPLHTAVAPSSVDARQEPSASAQKRPVG
jgi:hypothetical protein